MRQQVQPPLVVIRVLLRVLLLRVCVCFLGSLQTGVFYVLPADGRRHSSLQSRRGTRHGGYWRRLRG